MKNKIIVSDPGDEVTHAYDGDSAKAAETKEPIVEPVPQNEAAIVDPSYMNTYD